MMEHSPQRMWFKLCYQSLKISPARITKRPGGTSVARGRDEHRYLIHPCISLASMIHFLRNAFQNVLMTSRPRPPQTHRFFSTLRLSEGLFGDFRGQVFPAAPIAQPFPAALPGAKTSHCKQKVAAMFRRVFSFVLWRIIVSLPKRFTLQLDPLFRVEVGVCVDIAVFTLLSHCLTRESLTFKFINHLKMIPYFLCWSLAVTNIPIPCRGTFLKLIQLLFLYSFKS